MSRTHSFFRTALPWVFTFALIMIAIPLWAGAPPPQVVTIEATKTVRIVLDGKDVAVFDSQGLHVQGDVGATGGFDLPVYRGSGPAPLTSSPARKP